VYLQLLPPPAAEFEARYPDNTYPRQPVSTIASRPSLNRISLARAIFLDTFFGSGGGQYKILRVGYPWLSAFVTEYSYGEGGWLWGELPRNHFLSLPMLEVYVQSGP